ncbi:hypothetical protein SCOR_02445 [Sulfidibacter corallicola]|uniref:Uncharacterized protein n=1 Tax=Sulfidibacter corallicola TaxID=2818388 RepID=A0A8A4TF88_SULCO|nr:hypothetical protein [Sulfidibacter corallicola]QTD48616.1 hypothetical protein J3U87_23800 [Sulfidibacter corallicola]
MSAIPIHRPQQPGFAWLLALPVLVALLAFPTQAQTPPVDAEPGSAHFLVSDGRGLFSAFDQEALQYQTRDLRLHPTETTIPRAMAISPDGRHLAVVSGFRHYLTIIDRESWQVTKRFLLDQEGLAVGWSADSQRVFATTDDAWRVKAKLYHYRLSDTYPRKLDLDLDQPSRMVSSPDNRTLAIIDGASNGKVTLFDLESDTVSATVNVGHHPRSPVFSLDGSRLYIANHGSSTQPDTTISVIEVTDTPTVAAEIEVGDNPTSLALSPDGRWLALGVYKPWSSASKRRLLAFVDTQTHTLLPDHHQISSAPNTLAWTKGRLGLWAAFDGDVRRFDLELLDQDDEPRMVVQSYDAMLGRNGLALYRDQLQTPDAQYSAVMAPGKDKVFAFDIANLNTERALNVGNKPVAMVPGPDSRFVYVAVANTNDEAQNYIREIDLAFMRDIQERGFERAEGDPAWMPDGDTVWFTDSNRGIWSTKASNLCVTDVIPSATQFQDIAISPDGTTLAAVRMGSSRVSLYDLDTKAKITDITAGSQLSDVAYTEDGSRLIATSYAFNRVYQIDTTTNRVVLTATVGRNPDSVVVHQGFAYTTNYRGNSVSAVELGTRNRPITIDLGNRPATLHLNEATQQLFVLHANRTQISVIDLTRHELVTTLRLSRFSPKVAFSADGSLLAVPVTSPYQVAVFDTASLTQVATISVPNSPTAVCFSLDGEQVQVLSSTARTLMSFDLADGSQVGSIPVQAGARNLVVRPRLKRQPRLAFPDPGFKAYLVAHFDTDCDGELDQSEAEAVRVIRLPGSIEEPGTVAALTGIEAFSNLVALDCRNQALTTLPTLPQNLRELWCDGNQITTLPNLPEGLQLLSANQNDLAELPELPNGLLALMATHNRLETLPLETGLARLHILDLGHNPQLDLTGLVYPELWWLGLNGMELGAFPDLSGVPELRYLDLADNVIEALPSVDELPAELLIVLDRNPVAGTLCDSGDDVVVATNQGAYLPSCGFSKVIGRLEPADLAQFLIGSELKKGEDQ